MDFLKKKKELFKIPKTVQQTIPYIECYENGMMQLETSRFSKSVEFEDISFKTKSEEEQEQIYEQYQRLLNGLNDKTELFLSFVNHKESHSKLKAISYEKEGDEYDIYKEEMNRVLEEKINLGRANSMIQKKIATFVLDAKSVDEADDLLKNNISSFKKNYRKITNTTPSDLNLAERMLLFNSILRNGEFNSFITKNKKGEAKFNIESMKKQRLTTKDVIAPSYLRFYGECFQIEERYGQAMFLDKIANWMNTDFLADLIGLNIEGCYTLHIKPTHQTDSFNMLKRASVIKNAEKNDKEKSKSGYVPNHLFDELEQIAELQDDLSNRDQKLFYASICLVHFADSKEELEKQKKQIKSIGDRYACNFSVLNGRQEKGFSSALPFGIDKLSQLRMLTTESLGVLIPLNEVNLFDEDGVYYGVNPINKSIIMHNRLYGQNYNGLVFGSAGSGKSFSIKREIVSTFLKSNDDYFIIDPDGDYLKLGEELGAEIISISPGNGIYINPFDLDVDMSSDSKVNPLTTKVDFICGMLETMLGDGMALSPIQKSIVDKCIQKIYRPYLQHLQELPPGPDGKRITIDRDYCPTMQNLFDELLSQPQVEAQDLALVMQTYTTGSFDTFAHRTNVDLNNRMVIYDIRNIGENLLELALEVCLSDMWNRTISNRKKNKWTRAYIDEFHLLLANPSISKFLKSIWKRGRKFQLVPTGITQNVEDLLLSPEARAIINNSSFVYMMNQSKMDRDALAQLLGLTENDISYITNAPIGSGLIFTKNQAIPFEDNFPSDTNLYKLFTTNPNDDLESA